MKKRIIIIALALITVTALALTALVMVPAAGTGDHSMSRDSNETQSQPVDQEGSETGQLPEAEPTVSVTLNTTDHIAYIMGDGAGHFHPDSNMTRAEIAVTLYRLLSGKVPVTVSYTDVPVDSWYADAAVQLGSLGVLRAGESTFQGDGHITRGEFVHCIAAFFPPRADAEQFPDVRSGHKFEAAILSGRAYGWLDGYADGTFRPEQPIQRSEAVAILNRALGRTGDTANIEANRPALFLDVPVDAWYYDDVMEATVPHTYISGTGAESWASFTQTDTGLPADFQTQGFHLYQGWCYYFNPDTKDIFRACTNDGFTYGADGHFTSGDDWVDQQLREIILSQTDSSMTGEEMLRALFAYCRDHYKYLKWHTYSAGDTSFTLEAAQQMLSTGRGNCYCYASTFWYLARWLGYDAKIISGSLPGGPHSWVEIDGYIYDTQLEWRYVHDYGRSQYLWAFYHRSPSKSSPRYRR